MHPLDENNDISNQDYDYERIAKAIAFIHENFKRQPDLDEVAEAVHLSPFHFQRMFTNWAGVSPKKFLQYTTTKFAKDLMKGGNYSISTITHKSGLSAPSRLHDLFVQIEGMTPGEYKKGGKELTITYGFHDSPFGEIMIATTAKGICAMNFTNDEETSVKQLAKEWPGAKLIHDNSEHTLLIRGVFDQAADTRQKIKLNIKGTPFQLKVWEALLRIPEGNMASYNQVAEMIWRPTASRAVGSAIGKNPVALLIPCHRVIKKVGGIGEYHWGSQRKLAVLQWERCQSMKNEKIDEKRTGS